MGTTSLLPRARRSTRRVAALFTLGTLAAVVPTVLTASPASAAPTTPDLEWVRQTHGPSTEATQAMATDRSGNVYVAGRFSLAGEAATTAVFGEGANAVTLTTAFAGDWFVAKYGPDGSFRWAQRAGGGGRDSAKGVGVDALGNVYVTGALESGGTFGTGPSQVTLGASAGGALAKYSPDGTLVWATPFESAGFAQGNALSVDAAGNVFVAGMFTGSATFGSGGNAKTVISNGGRDGFVAKYTTNGVPQGVAHLGGSDDDELFGVAVDASNNVVTTGSFKGAWSMLIGQTFVLMSSAGDTDVMSAKFSNAVGISWLRGGGGPGADVGTAVTTGPNDGVVIGGSFAAGGQASWGPNSKLTSAGGTDGFLLRYSAAGVPGAATRLGGSSADSVLALDTRPGGDVYAAGTFTGSAGFGNINLASAGASDGYLVRLSTADSLLAPTRLGGGGSDVAAAVASDTDGSPLVAGSFEQTVTFGSLTAATTLASTGVHPDAFLARFAGPLAGYHPQNPLRILDTRDGTGAAQAKLGAGQNLTLKVAGMANGPEARATSVVLNVTITNATQASHLTVYPNGGDQPIASNLNFVAGETVANAVKVRVGSGDRVKVFNNAGQVDVIADVVGWYDDGVFPGEGYHPLTPARILDTRDGTGGVPVQKVGAAQTVNVSSVGVGGVPGASVSAVALNVTAVNPSADTHLTVWPHLNVKPNASSLNVAAGKVRPNLVIVPVGPDGKVSYFNNAGNVDIVADVVGWYDSDGTNQPRYEGLAPVRLLDTRIGLGAPLAKVNGGSSIDLTINGAGGLPKGGVQAVVLNVTATNPTATSHLTVWPSGTPKPTASNLNFETGQTVPNLVIAKVGANGKVSLFNNAGQVDVIADVVGWIG